ncbi:HlyD family secretion protein [Commensalibacter papalotli (ex Botero et al. 2024)]|uniref:Multidrug resistance efflux pump EmrA (EmrA) (PDB:4TKO) n=1 Tax=Commensalibacter papalotli (ex Botero et al. 2024) TaxID=2972766 RepID=A0ABM9HMS7_9PROT|nr:HlyD family secretion protein [Commensalibacter papalotli (ex Botero et al. 2024)]CAI3937654.1 Multidrug resistance efflux pump EmrA (EmrA) (PDB:4TKO) [Commensalibacter papalotli (ex Botero et al. 2024)]CAI3937985.1 Multidrug resistance efflux pump EmrA (EmrA) (PDB:4TKO) [Commensalibacter papalotli (ex Botero et al. 2024)]
MTDAEEGADQQSASATEDIQNKKKRSFKKYIIICLSIILIFGAAIYWWLTRHDIDTDDAFTAGRIVYIAPHVNGYVTDLLINDNQFVHKGQLLLKIDPRDYQAAKKEAEGNLIRAQGQYIASQYMLEVAKKNYPGQLKVAQGDLGIAKSQAFKAKTEYVRQHSIVKAATTQQAIDYSTAAYDQAKAEITKAEGNLLIAEPVEANIQTSNSQINEQKGALEAAEAKLRQAELNLGWTELRAPHDGWISKRNVEQGNYVTTGQSIMAIVEPEVWVIANYKETQITNMRPGQKVKIDVDAYPFLNLKGHIDSIQAGTGAVFSAFPPENATGNYVKIVQRVPVKILIDEGLDPKIPLALGLSVVPTVYTK